MPKDKDKEKDEKKEKEREREKAHRERKKQQYTLDISLPVDDVNPTKMEEDRPESSMRDLLTDESGRPFKEYKLDPDYEPPRTTIRLDHDVKMSVSPPETRTLKPYITTDFDTQYPLAPYAVIVALDEGHAYALMDQELKKLGRQTSMQKKYTLREVRLIEPGAFIISMGMMPDS